MRTVLAFLALILLGAGGVVYYKTQVAADPPSNFRTVTVKRGDLTSTISATGTVQAEEFVDVGAQVAGRIIDFGIDPVDLKGRSPDKIDPKEKAKLRRVDYNTVVHDGTVLAYIDPTLYKAQLAQADATLQRNMADLVQLQAKREQAAADWARAKRLRPDRVASDKDDPDKEDVTAETKAAAGNKAPAGKAPAEKKAAAEKETVPEGKAPASTVVAEGNKGLLDYRAMSDTDYDLAKANYRVAKANVLVGERTIDQSKAAMDIAKTNKEYCTISSPVEGVVIDRRVNIGQTVVAALNAPSLFLLAKDLTKMEVWASVNEADIGKILSRKDMPARFTVDALPGETFSGKVTEVRLNATMTQNVVTYTVVVTFDNSSLKIIPYLTANLQFEVEQRPNVLLVPNVALRWKPRKEQIDPEVRDTVSPTSSGRGGGRGGSFGKGGGKETQAAAAPSAEGKSAKSAKSGKSPKEEQERGRLWVKEGNFVRPIDVRIGVTDGTSTEVSGSELTEGMEVVVGEARSDQAGDDVTNPFAPKLFRGGQQKQKSKEQ